MRPIYYLLIIAVAWFVFYVIARMLKLEERFGWSIGPLFLLIRTKRFNNFLKRVAKKYARFWRIIGNISIFVGFILMFASIGLFLFTLIDFFLPDPVVSGNGPTIGIIIPGVTISFRTFLYLIIPLLLTLLPHEFAHGVVSHADDVELKSTGLLFFAIFFGAFVEPDEESLTNSSFNTKMRTFAAGIFPNVLLGLITIPMLIYSPAITAPLYDPADGVLIYEVSDNSPASFVRLERGEVIMNINQTYMANVSDFSNYMAVTKPQQLIQVNTSKGFYNIQLASNPSNETKGYLGVSVVQNTDPKTGLFGKFFPYKFTEQISWIVVVSFGSVLFNVLPIPYFLDGDKLLSSFLAKYFKNQKVAHIILSIFRFLAIVLFLANLILPIIRYGLVPIA